LRQQRVARNGMGPASTASERTPLIPDAAAAQDGPPVDPFNRAYNPPCVFSPYATCPLPLPQNVLPIRIEAGEKNWAH